MESKLTVAYEEGFRAVMRRSADQKCLTTEAPVSCGGSGVGFSPIDALASAYAGCVLMAMDQAARRSGFKIAGSEANVSLVMLKGDHPMVESIDLTVTLPGEHTDEQLSILQAAAGGCPVHNSLQSQVRTAISFAARPKGLRGPAPAQHA